MGEGLSKYAENGDFSKSTIQQIIEDLKRDIEENTNKTHRRLEEFNLKLDQIVEIINRLKDIDKKNALVKKKRDSRLKEVERKVDKTEENTNARLKEVEIKVDKTEESTNARLKEVEIKVDKTEENTKARLKEVERKVDKTEENTNARLKEVEVKVDKKEESTNARLKEFEIKVDKTEESTKARLKEVEIKVDKTEENINARFEEVFEMIASAKKDTDSRLKLQDNNTVDIGTQIHHRLSIHETNIERTLNAIEETNIRIEKLTEINVANQRLSQKKHENMLGVMEKVLCRAIRIPKRRAISKSPTTFDEWVYNMDNETLNTTLNDKAMSKISKCITSQGIIQVGLNFNLTYADIDQIQADIATTSLQAYAVLLKWRNKMGKQAIVQNLLRGLFEAAENVNFEALKKALDGFNACYDD